MHVMYPTPVVVVRCRAANARCMAWLGTAGGYRHHRLNEVQPRVELWDIREEGEDWHYPKASERMVMRP